VKVARTGRATLGIAVGISAVALAAAAPAGAHRIGPAAASDTPAAKVVAPATKLSSSTVLNVGDQAGTGAQAILAAAGDLTGTGSSATLKDGLKVTFADFPNGPGILTSIEAGSDDIGGVGDAPPVFADPSAKEVIVGVLKSSYTNAGLLVPPGSPITSIGELSGAKVAVGTGTSADYHFLTVLNKAGLKPSQVTEVNLSSGNAVTAGESGAVQAVDTWSPFVEQLESAGWKPIATGPPYGSPYSYQVASSAALKNPQKVLAIRDYLTALDKAYVYVKAHPLKWASAWASVTGLPLSVMSQATLDDPYTPIAVTSAAVQQEAGLVNGFSSVGEIPAKYNIAPYVTSAFSGSVTGDWTTTTTPTTKKKKK